MKKHKHKFKLASLSVQELFFYCSCGKTFRRETTKHEKKLLTTKYDRFKGIGKKATDAHYVWHKFSKEFYAEKLGWERDRLLDNAEKWARKYPEHIRVVHVDDSMYSSSILILIEHKTKEEYHGTTVMFVPQCGGEAPAVMFLYPEHCLHLMAALKEIKRQAMPIQRLENQNDKERWKEMNRVFKAYNE